MGKLTIWAAALTALFFVFPAKAADATRIVVLGDSLVAGYGLQSGEDYPSKLQSALIAKGHNVKIDNAGVSGDTSAGGLSRLDWSIAGTPAPSLVIVELGANDMLRGIDPAVTKNNIAAVLKKLNSASIPALIFGMKAPSNMDAAYRNSFDNLYSDLAKEYKTPLYPFFLDDVALNPSLNQADGIHPNNDGVAVIVEKTVPIVEKALKSIKTGR